MIVVIDNHMTASAKYADILLPDCTASEQMDFCMDASAGNMAYVIFADQAIQPRFESRNIYEMTSEIAKRMGWVKNSLKTELKKSGYAIFTNNLVKIYQNFQHLKSSVLKGSSKT